jgi:hypothetical protein
MAGTDGLRNEYRVRGGRGASGEGPNGSVRERIDTARWDTHENNGSRTR